MSQQAQVLVRVVEDARLSADSAVLESECGTVVYITHRALRAGRIPDVAAGVLRLPDPRSGTD